VNNDLTRADVTNYKNH